MTALQKRKINTLLKQSLAIILFLSFTPLLLGQKTQISTYKKEFKKVGKNEATKKLLSKSQIKINTKWDNYTGSTINTTDSLFFFDNKFLSTSFPSNSSTHKNSYLIYYFSQKTAKCPTLFSLLNYYQPIINENLEVNNLPKELKLLPAVLSAFNPNSDNGIGGTGYWHLNYPKAIKYGLTVNNLVDERKDFKKATKAAILYIKDLYKMYNNWELTLTAYSSGVVTVNKLLNRHSAKTYKEIYPYLPKETKDLVQAYVAMNYVYSYDSYGAITPNPIIETDTILIDRKLKFEALNHVINTKTENLLFLNPVLIREIFPSNFTAYLPKGNGEKFTKLKDSIYFYQDSVMLKPKTDTPDFVIPKNGEPYVYTVRSGDVLGLIADRNNVRVSQLQAWNNLSGTMINVGQKLTIYGKKSEVGSPKPKKKNSQSSIVIPKKTKPVITKKQITNNSKPKTQHSTLGVLTTYTVKSGDNLWIIAKKFSGVSANNIMDFNEIDGNLTVGQKIKIPKY